MHKGNILLSFISIIFLSFTLSTFAADLNSTQVYQRIIKNKVIRIGISKNYPPLNFNSGEKGLEMEMIKKLGEFLDVKVTLVPLDVQEYIPALLGQRVDIIIAGLSRNLVRARKIWFSQAYITVTPGVLARKTALPQTKFGELFEENPIRTIWDLKKLTQFSFAVKKGSSYEYLLKNHFPDMPRKFFTTNKEGLKLLQKGEVHGFVHDSLFLEYLNNSSAKISSAYTLLHGGRQVEKICIGLPFGDVILKNQIDLFIAEIVRQGYIDSWLKKFNLK